MALAPQNLIFPCCWSSFNQSPFEFYNKGRSFMRIFMNFLLQLMEMVNLASPWLMFSRESAEIVSGSNVWWFSIFILILSLYLSLFLSWSSIFIWSLWLFWRFNLYFKSEFIFMFICIFIFIFILFSSLFNFIFTLF